MIAMKTKVLNKDKIPKQSLRIRKYRWDYNQKHQEVITSTIQLGSKLTLEWIKHTIINIQYQALECQARKIAEWWTEQQVLQQGRLFLILTKYKILNHRFLRRTNPILNKTKLPSKAENPSPSLPTMHTLPITPGSFKTCSSVVLVKPSKQSRASTGLPKGLPGRLTPLRRPASPRTTQTATREAVETSRLSHPTAVSWPVASLSDHLETARTREAGLKPRPHRALK